MEMIIERFTHYKTGYEKLDEEHFALVEQMHTVQIKCRVPAPSMVLIKEELETLESMVLSHLIEEEQLMESADYVYAMAHKTEHNRIRERLRLIIINPQYSALFTDSLVNDLEDLIMCHIDNYDLQIKL